jgi:hypothetical protein
MLLWEYPSIDSIELRPADSGEIETFVRDGGASALVLSDGIEVAGHPAGKRLEPRFRGGRVGNAGGQWLFHVGLWTPGDFRDEFLAWYEIEHLPLLLECTFWDGCRFVEERVQKGCQFHAMHQLSDTKALDSNQRKRSRSTPWFNRLAKNDWFDGAFKRTLYKRIP